MGQERFMRKKCSFWRTYIQQVSIPRDLFGLRKGLVLIYGTARAGVILTVWGGQGAANLGHANPAVIKAVSEQAAQLISCPEMFYNSKRALLMEKLSQISGMQRVFLSNSGGGGY